MSARTNEYRARKGKPWTILHFTGGNMSISSSNYARYAESKKEEWVKVLTAVNDTVTLESQRRC